MRKILLSLAAAGSAFATATPAAAQYYYGQRYGYEHSYGYDHGYNNWGTAGDLQRRIFNVLKSVDGVRYDQREPLREAAIRLDRELRYAARNGLNPL